MSYLESLRSELEILENFEKVITSKLEGREDVVEVEGKRKLRRKTHTNLLIDDHQINAGLSCVVEKAKQWHEKLDRERLEDELSEIRNPQTGGIGLFYKLRRDIVEYHSRPDVNQDVSQILSLPERIAFEKLDAIVKERMVFSGEECSGRYLDVHSFYTRYINFFGKDDKRAKIGYLEFLDRLGLFMAFDIASVKTTPEYGEYVNDLLEYLKSFSLRAQPLVEIQMDKAQEQFEKQWQDGSVPGWKRKINSDKEIVDSSPEKLVEEYGGNVLKNELLVRGLKCGGRPVDRAKRLIECSLSDSVPIKQKLNRDFRPKVIAFKEAQVQFLVEHLGEFIDATKDRVIKKQTQSYEELEAELAAEEELGEIDLDELSDEENEDHILHNPLNLPLGWDGKPIPFWLYKLHGLGVEFKCEICGNYSYWGRRAFDRHFQEWRHAHGMRMLRIPNTKHFHDITKIQDALILYAKLRQRAEYHQTASEEYETSNGVKIDRKTYEDLKRQGLE